MEKALMKQEVDHTLKSPLKKRSRDESQETLDTFDDLAALDMQKSQKRKCCNYCVCNLGIRFFLFRGGFPNHNEPCHYRKANAFIEYVQREVEICVSEHLENIFDCTAACYGNQIDDATIQFHRGVFCVASRRATCEDFSLAQDGSKLEGAFTEETAKNLTMRKILHITKQTIIGKQNNLLQSFINDYRQKNRILTNFYERLRMNLLGILTHVLCIKMSEFYASFRRKWKHTNNTSGEHLR